MGISDNTKTSYVWKKIYGREQSVNTKEWYEEYPGALAYLHKSEVWADEIPVPAPSTSTDSVQVFDTLELTEDTTVANHMAWKACSTVGDLTTQIGSFIPPRFDRSYMVRVFGNDGTELATSHPSNWVFDYENGVLFFEHNPESYGVQLPIHIKVYRYIGSTMTDVDTSGGSGDTQSAVSGNVDGGGASTVYISDENIDGGVSNTTYNSGESIDGGNS